MIDKILNLSKKTLIISFIIFLIGIIGWNSFFRTDVGYVYHYQNFITGNVTVYTQPGFHFKIFGGLSTHERYKQLATLHYGSKNTIIKSTRTLPRIKIRFTDTYSGEIPVSFRFRLPYNKEKIANIHRDFRGFNNLVDALLVKTARDVVINTATQYTGEEFFQGGLNQFKDALIDQFNNGIYKTERKQVEIEQVTLASVGLGQEDSNKLKKAKTLVWKTVPVEDNNGNVVRLDNPLDNYGITVTQITLGNPVPEKQLDILLNDKKRLVADRIKTIQEQETTKEQAKTAQLRADIERTKAKQEALKQKDLKIISKQREVEEAEKQAEKEIIEYEKVKKLAEIQKSKELAIAQAEREIQKANYEASQFEAKAIQEKGLAEANVLKAKYEARIPEIYFAELQKEITNIIYPNLNGINVTMSHNVTTLGNNDNPNINTNLDVLSSFATIGIMEKLEGKVVPVESCKVE